jgi:hypothetical protein
LSILHNIPKIPSLIAQISEAVSGAGLIEVWKSPQLRKQNCIKNETRVREAEGIFKIEVPDNIRKIVIVKTQVHGVMTYITPLFFAILKTLKCLVAMDRGFIQKSCSEKSGNLMSASVKFLVQLKESLSIFSILKGCQN